jgi:hypothetical protein
VSVLCLFLFIYVYLFIYLLVHLLFVFLFINWFICFICHLSLFACLFVYMFFIYLLICLLFLYNCSLIYFVTYVCICHCYLFSSGFSSQTFVISKEEMIQIFSPNCSVFPSRCPSTSVPHSFIRH